MHQNILFVCLGNICRSPTAEGVFRARAAGHKGRIDSAGTGAWHVGEAPDSRATVHADRRGYDLRPIRARQVTKQDFDEFDMIVAMDASNLRNLEAMRPEGSKAELRLMLDFATDAPIRSVPDPYYGGERGFEEVLDLIEDASDGLAAHLRRR